MFEITLIDKTAGKITVEDPEFGLIYEFHEPELKEAKIVDQYDLRITTLKDEVKLIPILKK
jgi:hypothetical protein